MNTKELIFRYIYLILGILFFSAAGLFLFCSHLGMDPLSVFYSGVCTIFHIQLGTAALIVGIVVLILLLFLDRSRISVGTVAVALGIGPLINLLLYYFSYNPTGWFDSGLSTLAGLVGYSLGMTFYLHANLGCGPVDALMLFFCDKCPIDLKWFKVLFDMASVVIGWVMGGVFGVGTLIVACLSGPLMCAFMKILDKFSSIAPKKEKHHKKSISDCSR